MPDPKISIDGSVYGLYLVRELRRPVYCTAACYPAYVVELFRILLPPVCDMFKYLNNKKETRRPRELSLEAALCQICSTRSVASGDASCAA